jgi:hypothetical protein
MTIIIISSDDMDRKTNTIKQTKRKVKTKRQHDLSQIANRITVVIVGVLAPSVVDRVFEPRSGQTKNYKIGMCCFSTKHTTLRSKSKVWLAHNQNNVSEWSDKSTRGLLFQ